MDVPLSDAAPFPLPRQYSEDIVFNPGDVNLGGQPSVLARVGVALTYRFPVGVGGQPGPIATFLELGVVQIYDGAPERTAGGAGVLRDVRPEGHPGPDARGELQLVRRPARVVLGQEAGEVGGEIRVPGPLQERDGVAQLGLLGGGEPTCRPSASVRWPWPRPTRYASDASRLPAAPRSRMSSAWRAMTPPASTGGRPPA